MELADVLVKLTTTILQTTLDFVRGSLEFIWGKTTDFLLGNNGWDTARTIPLLVMLVLSLAVYLVFRVRYRS